MRTATRISAIFAVLCLGISATLTVIRSFVDLEAGQCPAGCWITSYSLSIFLLEFSGVLSLIVLGLLVAVQAGRQHLWAAGMAFLALIALGIWGALDIATLNALRFLVDQYHLYLWPQSVIAALLMALAPLPGLTLSFSPFQRASSAPVKVLARVALVSLLLACASLWFFEVRWRQTDGPYSMATATQLLGAIALYLVCWLLGAIALSLSLLRLNKAPASASVGR
jgi:hypothetical protein